MIITIDGASGTGKSTVARLLAEKIHFVYFDTGAMYRAFTWLVIDNGVDLHDAVAVKQLLSQFTFQIAEENGEKRYLVNGHDVTAAIRTRLVTGRVSEVSALPEVRRSLLRIQHEFAETKNAVFEGRDLGTVIFPRAEIKIFLSADPQVRAERRLSEMAAKNPKEVEHLNREQILQDLNARDAFDSSREVAPLRCPEGAYVIDTTALSIDQVVDSIIQFAKERHPELRGS